MNVYQWFVFTHLVGLVIFVFAHGASAFTAYQIRTLRDPEVVSGYLTMSLQATRTAYIGLLLLLIGGAGAATDAGFWPKPWVWGSVVVLVVVLIAMYAVASPYYIKIRKLLATTDGAPPIDADTLARNLDSRVPETLLGVGGLGLLVLLWLMVMKPG